MPGPWCICMWAFARMYQAHPDISSMLHCNATNYWAAQMYDLSNKEECVALREICSRCNLYAMAERESLRLKCGMTKQSCAAPESNGVCSALGTCGDLPSAHQQATGWNQILTR